MAADFTGLDVATDWRAQGDAYRAQAMGYLTDAGGLLSDIRAQLLTLIGASIRGTPTSAHAIRAMRAGDVTRQQDGGESLALALLGAVAKVFDRNSYRIENWSGRLVELANKVGIGGMRDGDSGAPPPDDGGKGRSDDGDWMVEWVAVGDGQTCGICEDEAARGFQPLAQLRTQPGGATYCRGRCRCVLVYWTRGEVTRGEATRLSGAV